MRVIKGENYNEKIQRIRKSNDGNVSKLQK